MRATAPRSDRRPRGRAGHPALAGLLALGLLLVPAAASAAPPLLWQKCPTGSGAGQCTIPRGVAADPDNGHVFVADQKNSRIEEFNPLGQFVKTWGRDVIESGPDDNGTGFEICVPEAGDVCKAGSEGSAAGELTLPQGVALDSAGDVYVVDVGSPTEQTAQPISLRRVEEFNRAGEFLRSWGRDVVLSGPDDSADKEEQELTVAATAGSFRLGFPDIVNGGQPQETLAALQLQRRTGADGAERPAHDRRPRRLGLGNGHQPLPRHVRRQTRRRRRAPALTLTRRRRDAQMLEPHRGRIDLLPVAAQRRRDRRRHRLDLPRQRSRQRQGAAVPGLRDKLQRRLGPDLLPPAGDRAGADQPGAEPSGADRRPQSERPAQRRRRRRADAQLRRRRGGLEGQP